MFCSHIYAQVHCIQTKGFAITQLFFMYIVQLCVQGFREMTPNAILRNLFIAIFMVQLIRNMHFQDFCEQGYK